MDINEKKEKLDELVNQFQSNIKQYKSSIYDEANTRVDFIDKFFELLDWDVRNLQGYSEQYREVVREDKIQIEGKQKAPDYSFRIGKERKFFVEAKKPSVYIKEEISPAFQVRRYGYTAKLPLSILTDFEEFAIYDTRIKPDKNDKASVARIFYCTYDEYEKHFDFIFNTFSKSAILKGSFDKYIEENKNKKGTGEVDKELLKLVEDWRTELAKNIALRNNDIDIYNLNNAVQKIIDRIIFLRIAEDKEIEPYENLLNLTKIENAKDKRENFVYYRLNNLFITANNKYNAGLFQPEEWLQPPSTPDLSRGLRISDKVLISIIKGLYYPECPYEFSILPIEILGNIYEQFLGKTIKFRNVKDGHTAIIEEKPEVRKAGGVYYTPQYIVNYIVENTIGEKIRNQTLDEISKLKICDPACGSGSFLVGAYQYLLNFYLEYWTKEKNLKKALKEEKIYQVSENNYKLTIEEKQKILINNIYGVDIDPQAVEVTKLSLYLKLLENESKESEGYLFKHSDFKLLPSLDNNIKCGNSLIGSDFYTSRVTRDLNRGLFPDLETMRKVNVFDWEKEFPEIFGKKSASKFHLITFETKYSRISNGNEAVLLKPEEIDLIVECFINTKEKFGCKILACSILPDHVHIIIADMGNDIEKIVKHLKGNSAVQANRRFKSTVQGEGFRQSLWSKSYNNSFLEDETHLFNALEYVKNNHLKHVDKWEYDEYAINKVHSVVDPFTNWDDYEFDAGGFDVVIGNPPYVRSDTIENDVKIYLNNKYISAIKQYDIYVLFIEKGISILKTSGLFGYIVSNKFLISDYGLNIRKYILDNSKFVKAIDVSYDNVFSQASVYPYIIILERESDINNRNNNEVLFCDKFINGDLPYFKKRKQKDFYKNEFHFDFSTIGNNWINKVENNSILLGNISNITRGFRPPPEKLLINDNDSEKYLIGKDIKSGYFHQWNNNFVKYDMSKIPESKPLEIFKKEKIFFRDIGLMFNGSYDNQGLLCLKTIYFLYLNNNFCDFSLKYILSLLNSRLLNKYFHLKYSIAHISGGYLRFRKQFVENLPIRKIDFSNSTEKAQHDKLVSLVDQMLETQKLYHNAKSDSDKKLYKQKIDLIDNQIDNLVYKLYGLTDEEIKIVEGNNG